MHCLTLPTKRGHVASAPVRGQKEIKNDWKDTG